MTRLLHKRFAPLLTLLFLLIAGIGMYNHEMWRDEFEIFMELRDTPGFLDLFPNIQPLPNLYYALLYPLIHLWPYPAAFQIFHLLVITAAVYVFNKYSPFTGLQKVLFTFSYFVLFEYGIISRDYSMFLLLLFLLVYAVTREKRYPVFTAVLLVLLANHHLYGLFVAISIIIVMAVDVAPRMRQLTGKEKNAFVVAGGILAAGSVYLFSQYSLLLQFNRFVGFDQAPFFMTLRSIWNAFFPVPGTADMHFWNTNIISFPYAFSKNMPAYAFITAGNMAAVAASLLILLGSIVVFSRKRFVLAVYLANSFMQLAFLQYLSVFYVRYQGPLFLIFIYSYWLLQQPDKEQDRDWQGRIAHFFERPFFLTVRKAASPFMTFVLCVQFAVGVFCYGRDVRYPFTASYEAAGYIREQKLEDTVMVGYIDFLAEPISGLLNRKIYYPQRNDFGTYVVWRDTRRREIISLDEILLSAVGLHQSSRKNVLIILQAPLRDEQNNPLTDREIFDGSRLRFLKEFTRSIVPDERYYLYLIYGGAQVRSVQTLQNS